MQSGLNALRSGLLSVLFIILTAPGLASARVLGPSGSSGGDNCEARIQQVAHDIQEFLVFGGSHLLEPVLQAHSLSAAVYATQMLRVLEHFSVSCIQQGDPGYPILINGRPKMCRNWIDANGVTQLECDLVKVYSGLSAPEDSASQFRLTNHEFAAAAGLEPPDAEESNYFASNETMKHVVQQGKYTLSLTAVDPHPEVDSLLLRLTDIRIETRRMLETIADRLTPDQSFAEVWRMKWNWPDPEIVDLKNKAQDLATAHAENVDAPVSEMIDYVRNGAESEKISLAFFKTKKSEVRAILDQMERLASDGQLSNERLRDFRALENWYSVFTIKWSRMTFGYRFNGVVAYRRYGFAWRLGPMVMLRRGSLDFFDDGPTCFYMSHTCEGSVALLSEWNAFPADWAPF